jgi:predicted dienelactone hydrolase
MRRRTLLATRAALLAAATLPLPARAATATAGTVQDLAWTDAAGRALQVLVRWPAAGTPGPWPVLLHSHGLGGSRQGGAAWGGAWAAAGQVVLHLQHAGSDLAAVRRLGIAGSTTAAQLLDRCADVRQALDAVQRLHGAGTGLWARVRPTGCGLSGHSFGAHTVLAMAGQRPPMGAPVDEPRLAAFIALSPTLPRGDAARALAGVTRPLLVATGSEDADVIGNGATPENRRAVFDALPPGRKALLWLDGADHATFGGGTGLRAEALRRRRSARDAAALLPQHQALIAATGADWWKAWLQDDAAARTRLQQPAGLGPQDRWQLG